MKFQIPFVASKLSHPVAPAHSINRPRLATMLLNGVTGRLLLVCAGPGYGKTTLLAGLADLGYQVVWYSLGYLDRDLPVFFSHLVAGIARHHADFGRSLQEKLESARAANQKDVDSVLRTFVNELVERINKDIVIVLDDYHLVEKSSAITYAIDYLLCNMPAYVHLVIASRSLPQFPCLPRLTVGGQVFTIEEDDLRFTEDEVVSLFAQTSGFSLDPPALSAILKQTEGWAIALKLVDQSWRAGRSKAEFQAALPIRKDTLFSYFAEEVLHKQSKTIQAFLVESSIFSRLNPTICDAVLGRSDSAKVLSLIESNGLFLTRLDHEWFRCHHLFQTFLQERLSQGDARKHELHRRAAVFFAENGDEEQAVRHFLHAKDYATAANLASKLSEVLFRTGRFESLSYIMDEFPREVSGNFPDLLVWAGKALEVQGRFQEALNRYDKAEGLYKGVGDSLGLSRTLRSKGDVLLWARAEPGQAEVLHRQALGYLGDASRLERAAILNGLSNDAICAGNSAAALEFFNSALQIYVEEADELGEMRTLVNPGAIIRITRGEFGEAHRLLARAEQLAVKVGGKQDLAECYRSRAAMLLFSGAYSEAKSEAQKAIEAAQSLADSDLEGWSLVTLGGALDGLGGVDSDFVVSRFRQAYDIGEENGNRRVVVLSLVGLTNHYRRRGNLADAESCAREASEMIEQVTDQWLRAYAMRHIGMLEFARNSPSALQTLTKAWLTFAGCEDKYNLAFTHLWLAAVHEARGEIDDERYHLKHCLDLARANDYLAAFTQEPEIITHLLRDAVIWNISIEFVRRLLVKMGSVGMQVILSLLTHHEVQVRLDAVACLAEAGGVKAALQLRELSKEQDQRIRCAAEDGLKKIANGPAEPLTVSLLGQVAVRRGGFVFDSSAWKRKKAKALLAFLALQKGRPVYRDALVDKLWPEADWPAALNQLNVSLHDLRQVLEPERDDLTQSRYVLCKDGWYSLSLGQGGATDVQLFEKGLQAASTEADLAKAISQLEQTLLLYNGELMRDLPQEEWCMDERERLQELYLSSLERLAGLHERKQEFHSAIACHRRIISQDNCREEIHRALINLYVRMGNRRDAIKQYRACVRVLRDELGVSPERATTLAYERALA